MIHLSTTTAQTLEPGQSITFDKILLHTGSGECFRLGTSSVKMRADNGTYEICFHGNIGSTAAGTAQVSVALSGDILTDSAMIATTAAAGDLNSVSCTIPIRNCCCDFDRVSIVNSGTSTITVGANASFFVKRVS